MPVERQVEIVRRVKGSPPARLRAEFLRKGDTCSYALERPATPGSSRGLRRMWRA